MVKSAGLLAATAILKMASGHSIALAEELIVGLWQATWKDATSGDVVLNVGDVWHSDHTETQNDSGPVIAGFVCQGAWTSLGQRTYGLTHPSFNYVGANE